MFTFTRRIANLINLLGLERQDRNLVFYSEGKNYWVHLEGLVNAVLASSDQTICYVSSSPDDPGLQLMHPRYRAFEVGEGYTRDWLFANIDADVMVMTMPDLGQYQVARSRHNVHYVYVQHSLVSLHMVYRPGAFEHYDSIFCAGPHHIEEMNAIVAHNGYRKKHLIKHGYARLDSILAKNTETDAAHSRPVHVLIAPSWGQSGTIESGCAGPIIDNLLDRGYKVTLRPHPQTLKFSRSIIDELLARFESRELFYFEDNVAGQDSLHASDLMVSDWSGASLDYALGLKKPVIFIDVPKKVNDPNYTQIKPEPIEISIRDKIGIVVPSTCTELPVEDCLERDISALDLGQLVYNPGTSDKVGAEAILDLLR